MMSRKRSIDWEYVNHRRGEGASYGQIAGEVGCSRSAIYHIVNDHIRKSQYEPHPIMPWTTEHIEYELRQWYLQIGRSPTTDELGYEGLPSRTTLVRVYGSVKDAYQAVGIPYRPPGEKVSDAPE